MDDESNNTNNESNDQESFASALIGQIHNSWFNMLY